MATQYEKRMAKKKESKEDKSQEVNTSIEPTYSKESFDIFLDEDTRKYMKVTVAYDLATGLAKVTDIEPVADNQALANYKMKEIFAKKIMNVK